MKSNETRVPHGSGLLSSRKKFLSWRKSGSTEFLIHLAIALLAFSWQHALTAQLTILHNFGDGTVRNDGAKPEAGLIQAPSGYFFGVTDTLAVKTTPVGGTVFRMTPSGKLEVIHRFGRKSWLWSTQPLLYYHNKLIGTTNQGPAGKPTGSQGIGSVYSIDRSSASWHRDFLVYFRACKHRVLPCRRHDSRFGRLFVWNDGCRWNGLIRHKAGPQIEAGKRHIQFW